MAYLQLTDLRKSFGPAVAVDQFNLDAREGEFVSFLGPSGCGKTTTMRMIAGFEQPDHGKVMIAGEDITNMPANRRRVGMVFQSYALFPHLSVSDNIAFGLSMLKQSKTEIHKRVGEMLDLIQMQMLGARFPAQLSGGQQQRVALARAIAIRPRVLLLDEPLSALDAKIRDELRVEIRRIQSELNITTIYVTHDQGEALALSDRVVVMSAGRIEQIGTPSQIYNNPGSAFVSAFVGTHSVLTGRLSEARDCVETPSGTIRLTAPAAQPAGDTVHVHLRPEALSINQPSPGANIVHGVVEQVMLLGSVVRITVRAGDATLAADVLNSPALKLPVKGEAITVSFAPEACHIL